MTRTELRKTWAERVAHFEASGQSAAAWCAAHHVQPHQLYYWRRKLRSIEQPQTPSASLLPQWLPLEIDETSTDAEASVVIRVHQLVLEARPGCSPQWLADLVRALMSRC
ncbi:IS66 family insertion sequence element accessory protein TnpA [Kyrpidia spormannii]|uniref:Transposase n=1 Tax=Kyrpidia spormannii TaxID=2055160 RepID=A0A6F9EDS7_9BACL|nr:helix-turn-helix domain-containing protein [Kyrpidia spormannii]CAB3390457.1 conserved protein of unknown function [Kyrpidia spormannii]CAB3394461.1 conserved protein of unknown function [Kyrpidia spormannii]